nr:fluoride efflux transporter CrcB [Neobacillus terrae]
MEFLIQDRNVMTPAKNTRQEFFRGQVKLLRYFLVGLAGIIGALLRYLISFYSPHWWVYDFPMATFLINMLGCFILGWFTTFLPKIKSLHPYLITALGTGMIGSFTTFSTFSVETVDLITDSKWGIAILYVLVSLWGGLFFSWAGYRTGLTSKIGRVSEE